MTDRLSRRFCASDAATPRDLVVETGEWDRRRAGLAAESRALLEDPEYVREAHEIAALMEELRGQG